MIRALIISIAAAALLAACGQNTNEDATTTAETSGTQTPMATPAVAPAMPVVEYVQKAAIGDMYEIESSRLALTKATSDEVKEAARMIADDHTRGSAEMKAMLATAAPGVTAPTALDAKHQAMIDALKAASGAEFDRLYLQQQATAHQEALMIHQGFSTATEAAPLAEHARKSASMVQGHIDHLTRLRAA